MNRKKTIPYSALKELGFAQFFSNEDNPSTKSALTINGAGLPNIFDTFNKSNFLKLLRFLFN